MVADWVVLLAKLSHESLASETTDWDGDGCLDEQLWSGVGFLRLSHPRLVCMLFSASSLLEMKFFQKLFPSSFCYLGGGGGGTAPFTFHVHN